MLFSSQNTEADLKAVIEVLEKVYRSSLKAATEVSERVGPIVLE